jgi:hypothetical protein
MLASFLRKLTSFLPSKYVISREKWVLTYFLTNTKLGKGAQNKLGEGKHTKLGEGEP